ncbi:MAG: hypothetical protein ABR970_15820 [Roseiarcus sp.]
MNLFWVVMPWLPYYIGLGKLIEHCRFSNHAEMSRSRLAGGEFAKDGLPLDPTDVQYFEVDASRSARFPQSKHYQIMHIPVTEDVSDPNNSDYLSDHHPDGTITGASLAVAFRRDAEPKHEIFYDRFFKLLYCTDELALRVLRAGCSGMRLFDPTRPFGGPASVFRTIRGLEHEEKWDPSRKILRTKLIQEMP